MVFKFKLTTQVQLESLESNARTFGELRRDIQNSHLADKINFTKTTTQRDGVQWVSTIKLIDKNSQVEYGSFDDAVLPQSSNVIFFVLPFEHKGGMSMEVVDDLMEIIELENITSFDEIISEFGYNELRSLGSALNDKYDAGIILSGKREDIYQEIYNWADDFYYELSIEKEEQEELNSDNPLSEAVSLITRALSLLISIENELESIDFVDNTTLTDLHAQAIKLQRQLNK
jgi:hypothetical protein